MEAQQTLASGDAVVAYVGAMHAATRSAQRQRLLPAMKRSPQRKSVVISCMRLWFAIGTFTVPVPPDTRCR